MARSAEGRSTRLTPRGAATRARILLAAGQLMVGHGVLTTTLDDVTALSGTSKSQLYRHFADKDALILAVIHDRGRQLLARQEAALRQIRTVAALQRWSDSQLSAQALRGGRCSCELGMFAAELSAHDERLRQALADQFACWRTMIAEALRRIIDAGELRADTDLGQLATGILAAVQGGCLLSCLENDLEPLHAALAQAMAHVRSHHVS